MLQARGYETVWDMSASEQDRQYFEGTGVLVLDRVNGVAYVNISERAHPDLAQGWADELGYKVRLVPSRRNPCPDGHTGPCCILCPTSEGCKKTGSQLLAGRKGAVLCTIREMLAGC